MKNIVFTTKEAAGLAALAVFGLLVPNGVFLYCFATDPGLLWTALTNPLSLVFIFEAFFLMLLFAWLLRRVGWRKPSGFGFIVLSLVGSLAFSVPAVLYVALKNPVAPEAHHE